MMSCGTSGSEKPISSLLKAVGTPRRTFPRLSSGNSLDQTRHPVCQEARSEYFAENEASAATLWSISSSGSFSVHRYRNLPDPVQLFLNPRVPRFGSFCTAVGCGFDGRGFCVALLSSARTTDNALMEKAVVVPAGFACSDQWRAWGSPAGYDHRLRGLAIDHRPDRAVTGAI